MCDMLPEKRKTLEKKIVFLEQKEIIPIDDTQKPECVQNENALEQSGPLPFANHDRGCRR